MLKFLSYEKLIAKIAELGFTLEIKIIPYEDRGQLILTHPKFETEIVEYIDYLQTAPDRRFMAYFEILLSRNRYF